MQLWAYGCVQDFLFLTSRINRHSLYPQAKAALLNDHDNCILVSMHITMYLLQ